VSDPLTRAPCLDEMPFPDGVGTDGPGAGVLIPGDTVAPRMLQVFVSAPGVHPNAVRGKHPSGIGAAHRGCWVEIASCTQCKAWWPREVTDHPSELCPRCQWASLPPLPDETRDAMRQLRVAVDAYQATRERNQEKEHDAFVEVSHTSWLTARVLLRTLEELYGRVA